MMALGMAIGLMLGASAPSVADTASIATASTVRPEATGLLDGVTTTLIPETQLYQGQTITTGPQGQVEIVFADNTHMVVGPGSSLLIETYLMRNGGTASSFAVTALGGTFRFITGNSAKSAYKIDTPTATIGVRGTKFDFSVDKKSKQTSVVLYEGEVELCPTTGGCKQVQHKCDVGLAETSKAQLISGGGGKGNNFPYIGSQNKLSNGFKISGAGSCGKAAPTPKADKPAPKPQPKSGKGPGKPNPVPDPLPGG